MVTAELLALAVALSMDAVAGSLARGSAVREPRLRLVTAIEAGLACGLAQGLMALLGALVAASFAGALAAIDHWVAFAILATLGLNMVRSAWRNRPAEGGAGRGALMLMAFGTSVDAAAAGVTLPLFGMPVPVAALAIGAVTAVLAGLAGWAGALAGARFGRLATAAGGLLLLAIGARILLEHRAQGI